MANTSPLRIEHTDNVRLATQRDGRSGHTRCGVPNLDPASSQHFE